MYFVDKDQLTLKLTYLNQLKIMNRIKEIIMHLNVSHKC